MKKDKKQKNKSKLLKSVQAALFVAGLSIGAANCVNPAGHDHGWDDLDTTPATGGRDTTGAAVVGGDSTIIVTSDTTKADTTIGGSFIVADTTKAVDTTGGSFIVSDSTKVGKDTTKADTTKIKADSTKGDTTRGNWVVPDTTQGITFIDSAYVKAGNSNNNVKDTTKTAGDTAKTITFFDESTTTTSDTVKVDDPTWGNFIVGIEKDTTKTSSDTTKVNGKDEGYISFF
jgi:hypothetical protein